MENELSYVSPQGHTVFTSKFLKNRGTCCKSACLHCPYGYTLKKLGLQFGLVTEADADLVQGIMQDSGTPPVDWKTFLPDHVRLIELKGEVCGVFLKNNIVIKHLYLKKQFQNQNLSREMVESYFFI